MLSSLVPFTSLRRYINWPNYITLHYIGYYINWLVFKVHKKLSLLKWSSHVVISIKLLKKLKQLLNNIPKNIILFVGNRSRQIQIISFIENRPLTNTTIFISRESSPTIKIIVFVGNHTPTNKKHFIRRDS